MTHTAALSLDTAVATPRLRAWREEAEDEQDPGGIEDFAPYRSHKG